jgi:hypothetical protein
MERLGQAELVLSTYWVAADNHALERVRGGQASSLEEAWYVGQGGLVVEGDLIVVVEAGQRREDLQVILKLEDLVQ